MVKLAQTIGATNIAQSMRQPMQLSSAVIEVRQNLYSDEQIKDMTRVFPFTDISYAGAEAAGSNSVIASCHIPMYIGVHVPGMHSTTSGLMAKPEFPSLDKIEEYRSGKGNGDKGKSVPEDNAFVYPYVMSDYIFGIPTAASLKSAKLPAGGSDYNRFREQVLYNWQNDPDTDWGTSRDSESVATSPIKIEQFMTENDALDYIAKYPSRMTIGYVLGPRDVRLFYTETAIAMMARRLRRVVEALGPYKPAIWPIGLGHLSRSNKKDLPWRPGTTEKKAKANRTAHVWAPSLEWDAGAVQYKASSLRARGTIYVPMDQVEYADMRKGFKYSYLMNCLGVELLETLKAIGADMNSELNDAPAAISDSGRGRRDSEIAMLQMLYASMFGTVTGYSAPQNYSGDPTSLAASLKDRIGMMFNSGHVHIDPAALSYKKGAVDNDGMFQGDLNKGPSWKYRGRNVSAKVLMGEFIRAYITFCLTASALESAVKVPLFEAHWLYTGSPKPEYVTEQLQMNYRSDVYFDGSSELPFTLIPSRLNPGEVLARIPTLMECGVDLKPNRYLGVRDPLPYGPVQELRFHGDKPVSVIEDREYTFSPVIEADATVMTQYRNGRQIHHAVWPRPTHYVPGVTRIGSLMGLLADTARAAGHYFWQPITGVLQNDKVSEAVYRTVGTLGKSGKPIKDDLLAGQSRDEIAEQVEYHMDHELKPSQNPQNDTSAIVPKTYPTGVVAAAAKESVDGEVMNTSLAKKEDN